MKQSLSLMILVLFLAACISPRPTPAISPISPLATPIAEYVKTPTPIPTPSGSGLSNSSMETPYVCPADRVCIPHDWRAWSIPLPACAPWEPGCSIPCPLNCIDQSTGKCTKNWGCIWIQPEFSPVDCGQHPYRCTSGSWAAKIFGYGAQWDGGLMRQVTATPGDLYEFWVNAQAWMCFNFEKCNGGESSDEPTAMHLRVGIDPSGGTVPTSTTVIWSAPVESFDRYTRLSIRACAASSTITLFTRANADWDGDHLRINNDVYLDDAGLLDVRHVIRFPFMGRAR